MGILKIAVCTVALGKIDMNEERVKGCEQAADFKIAGATKWKFGTDFCVGPKTVTQEEWEGAAWDPSQIKASTPAPGGAAPADAGGMDG